MASDPHLPSPPVLDPTTVQARTRSAYPSPFQAVVQGRSKQALGNALGLNNFGVNLVRLAPGAASALRHWHSHQDEFIYVLEGELTLVTNAGEHVLTPGLAAGFPAGRADGHCLVNRSDRDALYLEVGDRTPNDAAVYPDDDLMAQSVGSQWIFTHKDGTPY